jgi:hypothetical protein
MQAAEATASQTIKSHHSQRKGERSRASSEQLSATVTAADRCPLIPCMPDPSRWVSGLYKHLWMEDSQPWQHPRLARPDPPALLRRLSHRGAGAAPSPRITDLAGLHAALSSEGVQLLHSPTTQQQPPEQGQSLLHSGLKQQQQQHRQPPSQADAVMAGASQTSAKLGQVGNELSVISSRLQDLGRSKQAHNTSARALAAELGSGMCHPQLLAVAGLYA